MKKILAMFLVSSSLVFADNNSIGLDTVVGATLGVAIGNQIGSGNRKDVAKVAGGLLGAVIANNSRNTAPTTYYNNNYPNNGYSNGGTTYVNNNYYSEPYYNPPSSQVTIIYNDPYPPRYFGPPMGYYRPYYPPHRFGHYPKKVIHGGFYYER
ncbi:glycine zipper 2TM domain-containing protein [Aliarcobacter butzleri]|uniref:glycine zipper 2TM domain-containing protein n=1 Tax=Aliarcobacter butzleri TaxID=28197 RepID=UPI002B246FDF|nr:glycine zipper 2TM domain-containing protein [Aliarcobacter butzleri]